MSEEHKSDAGLLMTWSTKARALAGDQNGVTAIIVGLAMTSLVGFSAVAVDVGTWYTDKRTLQGAADAAAFSASLEYVKTQSITDAQSIGKSVAAQSGVVDGVNGVTVTVNMPPNSGPNAGVTGAAEVIISKKETLFFASAFLGSVNTGARAVAVQGNGASACVLSLDTNNETSISNSGAADVTAKQCGMYVDSSGSQALYLNGTKGSITVKDLSIVGNYSSSGQPTLTVTDPTMLGVSPIPDPYAGVTVPAPSGTCMTVTGNELKPGTYCSGIRLTSGGPYTLDAGTFIIPGGQQFYLGGGVAVNGASGSTGSTIVLTGNSTAGWATMDVEGGATLNFSAPASGALSGLAIFQDRAEPAIPLTGSKLAGGAYQNIVGAIDFPTQVVTYTGNNTSASCTQLIGYQIVLEGTSNFNNTCAGTGTKGFGTTPTRLVE